MLKVWKKPEIKTLEIKKFEKNNLTVESALYASGGHHGQTRPY